MSYNIWAWKGADAGEPKDYWRKFVTALKYEDLSKDILIKLLRETSRTLTWVGAYWHSIIGDKCGVDQADFRSLDVWIKEADFCIPRIAEALGIKPTNVASAMKFWQADPSFSSQLFKYNIDIVARDHAVLTITHCPASWRTCIWIDECSCRSLNGNTPATLEWRRC